MPGRYETNQIASHSNCSRRECSRPAEVFYFSKNRCAICHKTDQMRRNAKVRGKVVPSFEWCEDRLKASTKCDKPSCVKELTLVTPFGQKPGKGTLKDVASLQHNNDGSLGILCVGCNSGHMGSKLGDAYFDLDVDEKLCPACDTIKSRASDFSKNAYKTDGISNECKPCASASKKTPEYRGRANKRIKDKYASDPEFRAKVIRRSSTPKAREVSRDNRRKKRKAMNKDKYASDPEYRVIVDRREYLKTFKEEHSHMTPNELKNAIRRDDRRLAQQKDTTQ